MLQFGGHGATVDSQVQGTAIAAAFGVGDLFGLAVRRQVFTCNRRPVPEDGSVGEPPLAENGFGGGGQ